MSPTLNLSLPTTTRGLDAALLYADAGLNALACQPHNKEPLMYRGKQLSVHDATTNTQTLKGWWEWNPSAQVAIEGGNGVLPLDLDTYKNPYALEMLESLIGCKLPRTLTMSTPRGGLRLLFGVPESETDGQTLRGTDPVLGAELRWKGRYSLVYPSPGYALVDNVDIAPAPAGLIALLRRSSTPTQGEDLPDFQDEPTDPYRVGALDRILDEIGTKGDLSTRVWWLFRRLAELGLTKGQIRKVAWQYQPALEKERSQSGWLDADLMRFIEKEWFERAVPDEETFWQSREELTHIRKFAQAQYAQEWAVLSATLARVIASVHPSLVLPGIVGSRRSINLFVGAVGKSGDGKGIAESVAKDAFIWPEPITSMKPGSGEGLASMYMRRPKATKDNPNPAPIQYEDRVLFTVPEIDTLAGLSNRPGSTLLPELRIAYSGEQLGFQYSDPSKRLPVPEHKYRLCLIAGIQPTRAAVLFNDVDGGLPQRFVWMPTINPNMPENPAPAPAPMVWRNPYNPTPKMLTDENGNLAEVVPLKDIRVCDIARNTIIKARLERARGKGDALDGHALLTREKVAAALALLNGRMDITDEDWFLSAAVMAKSDQTRSAVQEALNAKNVEAQKRRGHNDAVRAIAAEEITEKVNVTKATAAIKFQLSKTPGEWVNGATLRRSINHKWREHFRPAIDALSATGVIQQQTIAGQGQSGVQYRIVETS